jgi:transcriptional regulator with XRE-family HTH domain
VVTTADKLRRAITRKFGSIGLRDAALRLHIPPGNLSEWLNGKREPNLQSIRDLAKKLNRTPGSLVGTEEAKVS